MQMQSQERYSQFEKEGYLVIEDFATKDEIQSLRARAEELLGNFSPEEVTFFSASGNREAMNHEYFRKSAGNVSFFLEKDACDEDGRLKQAKHLSVNKIGHALHDLDEIFAPFSHSDKISTLLKDLKYKHPAPVQSMYICKQPRIGDEVPPHRDCWFLYTDPLSGVGLWLALENATLENGCLFVCPKSHLEKSTKRYGKSDENLPMCVLEEGDENDNGIDLERFVALPVKAGTLVVLHYNLLHYSNENLSEKSRHAFTLHFIEHAEGFHWHEHNWLQRPPDFPFKPLY